MRKMKQVGSVLEIPLELIRVSSHNVRKDRRAAAIGELKDSIRQIGLLQPITVYPKDSGFEVLVGQRRYLAFQELRQEDPKKYGRIKAIVIEEPDERTARLMSLVENLQRTDLTASEKIKACMTLLKEVGTVRAVAEVLGWAPQTVVRWLKFAEIVPSEVREYVDSGDLSRADAMKIAASAYPNARRAVEIAKATVKERLTIPEKERLFEEARTKPKSDVDELVKEARKPREILTIQFHLVGIYKTGFERALRQHDVRDVNLLAQRIVQDWLDERGYTRK